MSANHGIQDLAVAAAPRFQRRSSSVQKKDKLMSKNHKVASNHDQSPLRSSVFGLR